MESSTEAQRQLCERVGVVPVQPNADQKVGIALDTLHLEPLTASGIPPKRTHVDGHLGGTSSRRLQTSFKRFTLRTCLSGAPALSRTSHCHRVGDSWMLPVTKTSGATRPCSTSRSDAVRISVVQAPTCLSARTSRVQPRPPGRVCRSTAILRSGAAQKIASGVRSRDNCAAAPSQRSLARRAQALDLTSDAGRTLLFVASSAGARLAGLRSSREIGCPTRSGRTRLTCLVRAAYGADVPVRP